MAAWLNVFVRNAGKVEIACVAQSVNVISPLLTSCVESLFLLFGILMKPDELIDRIRC
jgi:alpha-L-arabinofuranosidase